MFQAELLILIERALDTGTTDIGFVCNTTCHRNHVRKTQVFLIKCISTLIEHLTSHHDVTLGHISRAAAHDHFIIRHERKAAITIDQETILQGEGEVLGNILSKGSRLRINDTTRDIDTSSRSCICQTTSLNDQILYGLVLSIDIGTRHFHLAHDRHDAFIRLILTDSNREDILILQRNIGHGAIENTFEIHRDNTPSTVGFHTMEYGATLKGYFCDTTSTLHQRTDGRVTT